MKQDINLFSEIIKAKKERKKNLVYRVIIYTSTFLFLVFIYYIPNLVAIKKQKQLSVLLLNEQYLKKTLSIATELKEKKILLQEQLNLYERLVVPRIVRYDVIKEIYKNPPEHIAIQNMIVEENKLLSVEGISQGVAAISQYIQQIESFDIFGAVELSELVNLEGGKYSFRLDCSFRGGEYKNEDKL